MRDEGWTLSDLAGELWARGIDIEDVQSGEIEKYLDIHRPERVAELIERDTVRGEHEPY
jgi:hypothetical protein